MDLKGKLRVVPDFKGVQFVDITTLLQDGQAFKSAIDSLVSRFAGEKIAIVAGPESRGFVIGAPVAYGLEAGFVPVRKPGRLPAATVRREYSLEYGADALEIHADAIQPGQRVLIVDDLLATGGTAAATAKLVEDLGGVVVGLAFLIELTFLNGRAALPGYEIVSLIQY
ncbi:MAG: adenine phosphoribosyltransferase [Negativicutes bacterium]|nr:adenine phosphoribosyltransferase [Negativicutes bacterium]